MQPVYKSLHQPSCYTMSLRSAYLLSRWHGMRCGFEVRIYLNPGSWQGCNNQSVPIPSHYSQSSVTFSAYNNYLKHMMWGSYRALWWRHQMETFSRYWPFVRGNHQQPVDSTHKGQWRTVLMFSLICAWTNGWSNNRDTSDLRRHCTH